MFCGVKDLWTIRFSIWDLGLASILSNNCVENAHVSLYMWAYSTCSCVKKNQLD